MNRRQTVLAIALTLATAAAHAQVAPEQARSIALRALDRLDAGEYAQAEAMFNPEIAKAVPAAKEPVAEARQAALPMLVLQGGRDIQVVDADWKRWKSGFGNDDKIVLKHYAPLNHLGIAGEGKGSLAEYATPGHVDARLIADVADWIRAR